MFENILLRVYNKICGQMRVLQNVCVKNMTVKEKIMFNFRIPTRLIFGAGALNELNKWATLGKKALITVSNGKSTKANGYLDRTIAQLEKAGAAWAVFDEIEPNPLKSTVERGALAARKNGCDFIVALGGGSVMDASKAIATMATSDGDLWDYVCGGTGKGRPIEKDPLPIIAITTTAGTGSEVDEYGVITNPETHEKIGFGGDIRLFPVVAIVDPELMTTVPPKFTAYQGFDALFHSTETYICNGANEMSDMVSSTAIKNIGTNLAKAVRDGKDIKARTAVAWANTMSGYAMVSGGCTSEHSLEHAMSAYHQELPHGAGLIMISLAYYKHFIDAHVCDDRFVDMAKWLGKSDATKAEDFLTALADLQKACGVYGLKMSDYGITPEEFGTLSDNARSAMGGLFTRDRVDLTREDCIRIYERSYA